MKKIVSFLLIIFALSFSFCSCSTNNDKPETTENTTEAQAAQTKTGANGFGSQNIDVKNITEFVPNSVLFSTSDEVKIKYITNINTREIITNDRKSEDAMKKKQEKLNLFLQSVGITEPPEPSKQGSTLVEYVLKDGVTVSSSGIAISVTPVTHPITPTSTDTEICDYLKNNTYMNALAKYSGIDLDNMVVFRTVDPGVSDDNEPYCFYNFEICTKADNAVEQAYNRANNMISFSLLEPEEKSIEQPCFVGGYVWDNAVIKETTITADDFNKAAEKSDTQVTNDNKEFIAEKAVSNEQYIDFANKRCTIVYDITLADGYSVPVFRFYYPCSDGTVIRNDVPCIDISALS